MRRLFSSKLEKIIYLLFFSFTFYFLISPCIAEVFEVKLHKGWNPVSIPYETFYVVKLEGKVHSRGYVYNPYLASYELVEIPTLSGMKMGGKALWIYSFEEGSKLVIEGLTPFTFSSFSRYLVFSDEKSVWNFVSVPKSGMKNAELKTLCSELSVLYFNSSNNCWYSYNISTGEYKKYCKDKWELIGVFEEITFPENIGIWVKVSPACGSQVQMMNIGEQKRCGKGNPPQPDDTECGDGGACVLKDVGGYLQYVCISCENLQRDDCDDHPNNCGLQEWITRDGRKEYICTAKSNADRKRCVDLVCGKGEECCLKKEFLTSTGVCYNPTFVGCSNDILCKNEGCENYCRGLNRGRGSCTYSSSTPYDETLTLSYGRAWVTCYCELPRPGTCSVYMPTTSDFIYLYLHNLPHTVRKTYEIRASKCSEFSITVVDSHTGRVVYGPTIFRAPGPSEQTFRVEISFVVEGLNFGESRVYYIKAGENILGRIVVTVLNTPYFELKLQPSKNTYAVGEQVEIILEGSTPYQITGLQLHETSEGGGRSWTWLGVSLAPGVVRRKIADVRFYTETRRHCFSVLGNIPYINEYGKRLTQDVCVEVRGVLPPCKGEDENCERREDCCPGLECVDRKCKKVCKPENSLCLRDEECCRGLKCVDGVCKRVCVGEGFSCSNNDECCQGLRCVDGICRDPTKFSCSGGEGMANNLLYNGRYFRTVRYAEYCCEGKDDCEEFSACVKSSICESLKKPECSGTISLEISPNPAYRPGQVTYRVGGLSNCKDKPIVIGIESCENRVASCNSENTGCTITTDTPLLAEDITHTLYACIDKNGDGDFNDNGEIATQSFSIKRCTGEGDVKISAECCSGLITFQSRCLNPSKFRCRDTTLIYEGTNLEWACGPYSYCCEDEKLCGGMSACCRQSPCLSPTTTTTTQPTPPQCSGSVSLLLSPSVSPPGSSVIASASGLLNCKGVTVVIAKSRCGAKAECLCVSSSEGCACSFVAPSNPGRYTYYVCVDKNNDADWSDEGEVASKELLVCQTEGGQCSEEISCCEGLMCRNQRCIRLPATLPSPVSKPDRLPSPVFKLGLPISLKKGWNLVSFPFKDCEVFGIENVSQLVYVFDSLTSSYKLVNISKACGKGFWIYAHKDTLIEVSGTQSLNAKEISLIGGKPNLIAIPEGGLYVSSQRGNCRITAFYYYNSTDQTWYKWNATTGEYSKLNVERKAYEVLRKDYNPFIPEGLGVFIYSENECRLGS